MDADSPSTTSSLSDGYVGVDVVDLTADRLRDRGLSQRFLDRVFTEGERARIEVAADEVIETWSLWAAKEAAFKVVSKVLGAPPVFEHRAFEVTDAPGCPPSQVRYEDVRVALTVRADPEHVVVHGWNDPSSLVMVAEMDQDRARDLLEFREPFDTWCVTHFTPEERDALHSRASAFVRLLARRDAARFLDLEEKRLSIRAGPGTTGRRPPFLFIDGRESPSTDLSFSHHGNRLAWALTLPWEGHPRWDP
jgi:phosphopantetheinyl transferase (holo-ACP synthase)